MMIGDPVEHARRSLSRAVENCERCSDERFTLALAALVGVADRDPFIRAAVEALTAEAEPIRERFAAERMRIFDDLRDIATLATTQDPEFETKQVHEYSTARLRTLEGPPDDTTDVDSLFRRLCPLQLRETPEGKYAWELDLLLKNMPETSACRVGEGSAERRVSELDQELAWLHVGWRKHSLAHGGAAWRSLARAVAWDHPHPKSLSQLEILERRMSGLFGKPADWERFGLSLADARAELLEDVRVAVTEVNLRLGVRASHDVAIRRYARGAMWFRRDQLRELAEGDTRRAERNLTSDAATFLFSQGFDVLTEVTLGSHRLDIVSFGDALLIEAKVYRTVAQAKDAASKGLDQLEDYVGRFVASGIRTDNFLLIFRLGGERVSFPASPLEIGAHVVRIVEVDLATSAESGRNAKTPIYLSLEEILGKRTRTDSTISEDADA